MGGRKSAALLRFRGTHTALMPCQQKAERRKMYFCFGLRESRFRFHLQSLSCLVQHGRCYFNTHVATLDLTYGMSGKCQF